MILGLSQPLLVTQLPQFPSGFPGWWVACTAEVGAIASLLVIWIDGRWSKEPVVRPGEAVLVALVVALCGRASSVRDQLA